MGSRLRKKTSVKDHRPGQTISGPTMMGLADAAVYVALIAEEGVTEAVTSHLSINFLKNQMVRVTF